MFQTHSNFEHLCMMQHILGPIPKCLLEGSKKLKYFNDASLVNLDWNSGEGQYIISNCKPLRVSYFLEILSRDSFTIELRSIVTVFHTNSLDIQSIRYTVIILNPVSSSVLPAGVLHRVAANIQPDGRAAPVRSEGASHVLPSS